MEEKERDYGTGTGASVAGALAAGADPASRARADAFLEEQTRLTRLQIEDMRAENRLRHWSLRVRHVSDVMKLAFELAVAFIVLAIAAGLGTAIWQAAHADGLVIESFNVPPDMTAKGLTGQVVANKLLDRLADLQDATQSSRSPSTFASDWTNDIKVEIPDTGVSLGEVVRFLRGALGHETHLSGEIYKTAKGIALTVRLKDQPGKKFEIEGADLDALVARAAEAIFAKAQPYRYSVYLYTHGDIVKAYAIDKALAETGPASERSWANVGLANFLQTMGRFEEARSAALHGIAADPEAPLPHVILANVESSLSHEQAQLTADRDAGRLLAGKGGEQFTPQWRTLGKAGTDAGIAETTGDFRAAVQNLAVGKWLQPVYAANESALDLAFAHDPDAASALLSRLTAQQIASGGSDPGIGTVPATRGLIAIARQDWPRAAEALKQAEAEAGQLAATSHGYSSDRGVRDNVVRPYLAIVFAHLGRQQEADALLKPLPTDCDICARAHGRVETIRHHWAAAARWFALVSARSPHIPFADADWGEMLLRKGDLDGAIAKFAAAHAKGPHYADPLETWGEALIAKSRSDLALAKFEEANKYAPNWGRLHLKWGEALLWSGDKSGARKQFAIASHLDLRAAERAEAERMRKQ